MPTYQKNEFRINNLEKSPPRRLTVALTKGNTRFIIIYQLNEEYLLLTDKSLDGIEEQRYYNNKR